MLRALVTATALVLAAPAVAGPNAQLLQQIETGLIGLGIRTDVNKLSTSQAVAIHFALNDTEERKFGVIGPSTRAKVLAILRQSPATDPALQ